MSPAYRYTITGADDHRSAPVRSEETSNPDDALARARRALRDGYAVVKISKRPSPVPLHLEPPSPAAPVKRQTGAIRYI